MPNQEPETTWIVRKEFPGLQTKKDSEKVDPGAAIDGKNVSFNEGDKISSRKLGYEVYPSTGSVSTETTKVTSIHTFRRRDGTNRLMRAQGTNLEYYDETYGDWVVIKGDYTSGQDFGFADYNINTDQTSYVYFGNATESHARWSGAVSYLATALTTSDITVEVDDAAGFPSTDATIVVAGVEMHYATRTDTEFTLSATSTVAGALDLPVTQGVQEFDLAPKGNILMTYGNRIFIAGITATPQAAYFSEYGDATKYVGAVLVKEGTADSPGIFNLAEGGGGITGMSQDEEAMYILKESIVYKVTLSDSLYALTPLKPFDGKSQTTGGISSKATFVGENGVFFITPDKRIYYLARLKNIDVPQLIPISDLIEPTVDNLYFENAAGITYKDRAYFACSSAQGGQNDRILVYDIRHNSWQCVVTGFNVTDWTVYNNDSDGERLFFADNGTKNVYRVTTTPNDADFEVEASAAMNLETFDMPERQKYIDNFFVEGYLTSGTTLNITLLFDDDGYTQTLAASVSGDETTYLYANEELNVYGTNPFGIEIIGSNDDTSGLKKFRLYTKNNLRTIPFYNISTQFSSDGASQEWEVTNYGWKVGIYERPEKRSLYKSFS